MRTRGRVLLIALPLAVLLLGGAGAYYFFFMRERAPKPEPPEETYEIALPDLLVNLADEDQPHYLSTSVSLVVSGLEPEEAVTEREAHIRDAVIMSMTQHAYEDLLTPEGKESLKEDIRLTVGEVLADQNLAVTEVLFTMFLMD